MSTTTPLKVYSWTGFRREAVKAGTHHAQTHEIMAAPTAAEVQRVGGIRSTDWRHSGSQTYNRHDIALAMANPRRILWRPLNDTLGREWNAVDGEPIMPPLLDLDAVLKSPEVRDVPGLVAEIRRLDGIIARAANFEGNQTVGGVTDRGWMSPTEWELDQIAAILAEAGRS